MPGAPSAGTRALAQELVSIARSELPGLDAHIGYVDGDDAEFPALGTALARAAEGHAARVAEAGRAAAEEADEEVPEPAAGGGAHAAAPAEEPPAQAPAADEPDPFADGPAAVVVPLLAGPESALMRRIRQAVVDSPTDAELTDALGPHPLLAEALHVRLSESGLARADRARLFTVATAADGIILAAIGGEEAVQEAGVTGMLLAARLAVPVMAAALDIEGSIAQTADQLRSAGSAQLALAPYLIGPEVAEDVLKVAAEEASCASSAALGAYPAIGRLVLSRYANTAGVRLQQGPGTQLR